MLRRVWVWSIGLLWVTLGAAWASPLPLDGVGLVLDLPDGWQAGRTEAGHVLAQGDGIELLFRQNDQQALAEDQAIPDPQVVPVAGLPGRLSVTPFKVQDTQLRRVRIFAGDAQGHLAIDALLPWQVTPALQARLDAVLSTLRRGPPSTKLGWYQLIESLRAQTMAKAAAGLVEKGSDRFGYIITGLLMVAALGLLLLLAPLVWMRRHPGRAGAVIGYSSLSALLFSLTILGITVSVVLLQLTQLVIGQVANPKMQLINAGFDVMVHNLDTLMDIGPMMLQGPTDLLQSGKAASMVEAMLMNAQQFKADFDAFGGILEFFKGLSGLTGYLPFILSGLVVILLVVGVRGTLRAVVLMPDRVLSGEARLGDVLRQIGRRIGGELLTTLLVMFVLVGVTLASTWLMSKSVPPLLEALTGYMMVNFLYVLTEAQASTTMVYLSIGAVMLYFIISFVVLVAASALLVGKVHKTLRARFVEGVRLRAQQGLLWRGPILAAWLLVIPWLYVLAAEEMVERLLDTGPGEAINWTWIQLSGPLVMVVGFTIFFVAAQGWWTFRRLKGYPIVLTRG
jgi:hypothetical protein